MKRKIFLLGFLVTVTGSIGFPTSSYGSSQLHQNSYLDLSEKEQNCLAWRFYLMIGLDLPCTETKSWTS